MTLFKRPTVLYPTLVNGIIDGPIRCISLDGSELWLTPQPGNFAMQPFEHQGKTYAISHIQKKAKFFSLRFEPYSYHYGRFWHLQETYVDMNGVTIFKPGTEKGIYWRTPGFRWQQPDKKSNGTPWIWSWGRFVGTHLD
jgi:hypothetical protein